MTVLQVFGRSPLWAIAGASVFILASVTAAQAEPAPARDMPLWIIPMMMGIFFLFVAPFSAWYIYTGRKGLAHAKASASWPTTQGKILESGVRDITRRSRNSRTTTYWPFVRYEYTVDGKRYEGDVIQFGVSEQSTMAKAEALVLERPVGKTCTVYYKPDDPTVATLDTSSQAAQDRIKTGWLILFLMPIFGGAFLAVVMWFVA